MPVEHARHTVHAAPRCGKPEVLWPAAALLGEGLCWSPAQQSIYWVDILGQRLMRLHIASGLRAQWDFDEPISAVAERADAPGLVVALRHRIALFDTERGTLHTLHEIEPPSQDVRLNDGKCDAQGRFWIGSMGVACKAPVGSLHRVSAAKGDDGAGHHASRVDCVWRANFPVNNGPAWSRDGCSMWLNDTARNVVHRCDFDPASGAVSNPLAWLRLRKGDGYPDGMTTDDDGRLWIAHWAGGCVTCHAPDDGRELARVALPTTNVTNVAFGGADLRTLFVSSASTELDAERRAQEPLAGALFAIQTDATGCAPARFAG
jgi:sugar lactone lactonase YvrE